MKIAIIGSGMAGLFLCEQLHKEKDIQLTVFHNDQPDMASRGQSFLFHPFPGRSLEISPYLDQAVAETIRLLDTWKARFPKLIRSQAMLRYFKGSNGYRLEKSYQGWWQEEPKDWASFTEHSPEEAQELEPSLSLPYNSITYKPAYVVDFGEVREKLISYYQKSGASFIIESVQKIQKHKKKWTINSNKEHFDRVIIATGTASKEWFPNLKLSTQGGSLLQIPCDKSINHLFSLDGLHIGKHNSGDWVIGSTRWHHMPDSNSEVQRLQEKLATMFPELIQGTPTSLWSGNRCIYPSDRMPLCGELPHRKGIHVLTALGSKGMLWGPFSAKKLCQNILQKTKIPKIIELMRAKQNDGWFSDKIH